MKHFKIVFLKEIKDLFRNGLSLFLSIVLPALIFPIMITILLNSQTNNNVVEGDIVLSIINTNREFLSDSDPELYSFIIENVFVNSDNIVISKPSDLHSALLDESINLVLEVQLEDNSYDNLIIKIIYNQNLPISSKYIENFINVVSHYSLNEVQNRLSIYSIDYEEITPLKSHAIKFNEYFSNKRIEGLYSEVLVILVPMVLLGFIAIGSTSVSGELFTMEKERNTMESLMTTSAPRKSIFYGKYFVVVLISLLSAFVQFASLIITIIYNKQNLGNFQVHFEMQTIILMLISLIVLCLLSATVSVLLYVSAKSNKSVGAISSIYALIPIIISYSTTFLRPSQINIAHYFIPFYNSIVVTKLSMIGITNVSHYIISLIVNIFISIVVLIINVKIFESDKILKIEE